MSHAEPANSAVCSLPADSSHAPSSRLQTASLNNILLALAPNMEEENFTEQVIQDVEGCFRDFFLGCFNPCHSFDDEPEIEDGKLFGQNFEKIQVC